MEITVAEVLESKLLEEAKVVAGKAGLARPVSSVTVGEVPDIADWLKGGELVLSTLYAVSDSPPGRLEFVRKIISGNAAALFVKPGRFLKELDTSIIREAEKSGFPLVVVSDEVRWTDLIREIYDKMIKTEVEIRMKGDLIDDLMAGQHKPADVLRRAEFLGADLSLGCLALYVDIDSFSATIAERKLNEEAVQRIKEEALNASAWVIRRFSKRSLISLKSDNVIVFLTPPNRQATERIQEAARRLAIEIRDAFSARYEGWTLSVGLGRFYNEPEKMKETLEEARTALHIGRVLQPAGGITGFDEVGVYKLLLRAYENSPEDLRELYAETIMPLFTYDKKHGSELIRTLDVYLSSDLNLNKTAETLIAHRHTVRYRLERIAAITGLNPDKSEDLERLSIGLKAGRLLAGMEPV